MSEILVVDDDLFLADSLARLLSGNGFQVRKCHEAGEAFRAVTEKEPDLLILDLGLPDQDGISLCRRLRTKWQFPILILTSRTDTIDKVVGLEVGADDYLTKPFDSNELLARVRAQLRRTSEYVTKASTHANKIEVGPMQIDLDGRKLSVNQKRVEVTETEFKIVAYLAANLGRALSREQVFETVWGFDLEFSSNSLEVLIYRLRQKLDQAGCPHCIHTVRGYGYKMELA